MSKAANSNTSGRAQNNSNNNNKEEIASAAPAVVVAAAAAPVSLIDHPGREDNVSFNSLIADQMESEKKRLKKIVETEVSAENKTTAEDFPDHEKMITATKTPVDHLPLVFAPQNEEQDELQQTLVCSDTADETIAALACLAAEYEHLQWQQHGFVLPRCSPATIAVILKMK